MERRREKGRKQKTGVAEGCTERKEVVVSSQEEHVPDQPSRRKDIIPFLSPPRPSVRGDEGFKSPEYKPRNG